MSVVVSIAAITMNVSSSWLILAKVALVPSWLYILHNTYVYLCRRDVVLLFLYFVKKTSTYRFNTLPYLYDFGILVGWLTWSFSVGPAKDAGNRK